MKPINPFPKIKIERVESTDLKLKPIDKTARIVTSPAPWYCQPIPEKPSRIISESELLSLSNALKEERRSSGAAISKMRSRIADLEAYVGQQNLQTASLVALIGILSNRCSSLEQELKSISDTLTVIASD